MKLEHDVPPLDNAAPVLSLNFQVEWDKQV